MADPVQSAEMQGLTEAMVELVGVVVRQRPHYMLFVNPLDGGAAHLALHSNGIGNDVALGLLPHVPVGTAYWRRVERPAAGDDR